MAYSGSVLKRLEGVDRTKEKKNFLALSKPGDNTVPSARTVAPPTEPTIDKTGESLQSLTRDISSGTTPAAVPTVPDRGATVLGMPVDKFSQLAGGLGAALAPKTPMGRVGAFVSNLASHNIAEKKRSDEAIADRARRAAEKEAARATKLEDRLEARNYQEGLTAETRAYGKPLRELKIKSAEKQLSKKDTPTEFGAFRSGQIEKGITDESKIVENYKKLSRTISEKISGEKYPAILKRWKNPDNIDDSGNVKSGLVQLKEGAIQGDPVALKEYPEVAQQLGRLPKGEVRPIVNSETGEIVYFYPKSGKIYNIDGKPVKIPKTE